MSAAKSETPTTVKKKQLTGSSRRKKKHSFKRKIISAGNYKCKISNKSARIQKNFIKKAKKEKDKGEKAKEENEKKDKDKEENDKGVKVKGVKLKEEIDKGEDYKVEKEKEEAGKHSEEEAKQNNEIDNETHQEQVKKETINENESLNADIAEEKCKNLRSSDSVTGQCTSSMKQQCKNCKICSEHVENQDSVGDCKEKQAKNKLKFKCEVCAKKGTTRIYSSIENHKHHMAQAHEIFSEELKRFECTDCPKKVWFPTKSKFNYHLGTKHPGVMRFICEICTETFLLKANYKNHLKTHNVVVSKKFTCEVCKGTFVNKTGYDSHRKRFPGPHIKQKCSHCGFSFSREKHMLNHRCKILLLEAAARSNKSESTEVSSNKGPETSLKVPTEQELKLAVGGSLNLAGRKIETLAGTDTSSKKFSNDGDFQSNKRVVFHRILPRRSQDQTVYRPVQMQTQNVPESLVVQQLREIDLEGGTFIAAPANEPEQQFVVRDLNGHLLQGNQILQLDINDVQQEENQVYLADWNVVAPYVIREKSP